MTLKIELKRIIDESLDTSVEIYGEIKSTKKDWKNLLHNLAMWKIHMIS